MAVGDNTLRPFTLPVVGTSATGLGGIVRSNDNLLRKAFNAHAVDTVAHVQSGLVAARPATPAVGTTYLTTDIGTESITIYTSLGWVTVAGGGVSLSGSGTTNTIPRWTGATALGNSLLTQSGSTITMTGTFAVVGAATVSLTLGVTGISTFTGGFTMPTASILAQLPDNTRVGNSSTPVLYLNGFNSAELRIGATNGTTGREQWGIFVDTNGFRMKAFNDGLSLFDEFLTISQTTYNDVHNVTLAGSTGSKLILASQNSATPARAPLNLVPRTNAPSTLSDGDFFNTATDAFVRLGGVSRSLTSSTPAWSTELIEIVWGTPGAESANSIDTSASSFNLDAGAVSSDEIAVEIRVSDGASDAEPSETATLSAASTPLGTILGGSGTATLVIKATSSGTFSFKCTETAAASRFIWVKAGGHFQRFVKARDGILQLTFT